MNINQGGLNKASKRPRYENNSASSPIRQTQEQAVGIDDQEMSMLILTGIIQGNQRFTDTQLIRLVHHENIEIPLELLKHRSHQLQPHHIDALIARNNSDIDALFIDKPLPQMSKHQTKQLIDRIFIPR
jgi:hypothetical protein